MPTPRDDYPPLEIDSGFKRDDTVRNKNTGLIGVVKGFEHAGTLFALVAFSDSKRMSVVDVKDLEVVK